MLFLVSVEASFPGKGGTRPIFGYKLGLGLADPRGWGGTRPIFGYRLGLGLADPRGWGGGGSRPIFEYR